MDGGLNTWPTARQKHTTRVLERTSYFGLSLGNTDRREAIREAPVSEPKRTEHVQTVDGIQPSRDTDSQAAGECDGVYRSRKAPATQSVMLAEAQSIDGCREGCKPCTSNCHCLWASCEDHDTARVNRMVHACA